MTDVVDKATRSRMMSGIRGKNTKPEITLRKALHRRGLRYRLHPPELPGKPDIVLPRHRCVILVHGCFWHGHGCSTFKWPKQNARFWKEKISGNAARDRRNARAIRALGLRLITVWECKIRKAVRTGKLDSLAKTLAKKITA